MCIRDSPGIPWANSKPPKSFTAAVMAIADNLAPASATISSPITSMVLILEFTSIIMPSYPSSPVSYTHLKSLNSLLCFNAISRVIWRSFGIILAMASAWA